jgi:hypothetical protein
VDFIELNRLLEHSIQRNPLPALAAGFPVPAGFAGDPRGEAQKVTEPHRVESQR